jgi:hypothetical protein
MTVPSQAFLLFAFNGGARQMEVSLSFHVWHFYAFIRLFTFLSPLYSVDLPTMSSPNEAYRG